MSLIPDLPMWAWLLLSHILGLGGGFVLAIMAGMARAMEKDTEWVLNDWRQTSGEEEAPK